MGLPTTFNDFSGNSTAVEQLRLAIAHERLPHSIILSGPAGAGKYTLALMLTMAIECENKPRDLRPNGVSLASFCGVCRNCSRIAQAANLDSAIDQAVAAREELRESDKRDTRILIQPHPDVLIVPADPPQLLIKLGQIRAVIQNSRTLPAEAPKKIFILTTSLMMKEAANSILKVLEEPPEAVHIILIAENPSDLLPTIRSRCTLIRLGALPVEEIEMLLADRRPDVAPKQRSLIARLAQGAVGKALNFDLAPYASARTDAMILLRNAVADPNDTVLFKMTETYRAGAEGQQKMDDLLRTFSLLLEDLLMLQSGTPEFLRNTDLRAELEQIAQTVPFEWLENASRGLDQVRSGMRRNLLRSLSLDSYAAQLANVR